MAGRWVFPMIARQAMTEDQLEQPCPIGCVDLVVARVSSIGGSAYTAGVHTGKNCSMLPTKEKVAYKGWKEKLHIRTKSPPLGL